MPSSNNTDGKPAHSGWGWLCLGCELAARIRDLVSPFVRMNSEETMLKLDLGWGALEGARRDIVRRRRGKTYVDNKVVSAAHITVADDPEIGK